MDGEARTRRSGRQRACLLIGLLVAVCCCGVPSLLGWWALSRALGVRNELGWIDSERRKLPPLQPLPVPVDNGYDAYEAAAALLPGATEPQYLVDWYNAVGRRNAGEVARVLPEVRDYVSQAAPALGMMHEAASREFVSPAIARMEQPRPWLGRFRRLARVAAAAAYVAHQRGDDAEGLARVEDVLALGVRSARGGGDTEARAAVTYVAIGQRVSVEIVLPDTASPSLLRAHAARVRGIRDGVWPVAMSMRYSGAQVLGTLEDMSHRGVRQTDFAEAESGQELPPPSMIEATHYRHMTADIPRTREWMEDRVERFAEELERPVHESRFSELAQRTERDLKARNDSVADLLTPGSYRLFDGWVQMLVYLSSDETIACLEAYKKEKGAYPESLADLVPGYMPELPQDPWTGKPLIYRLTPERYTLYAVGPNGADDGGVTEGRGSLEPDLVIVPVPPPRQSSGP